MCAHRQADKNYIKEIQRLQTRALRKEEMLTLRCLWNLNSAPLLLIFVAIIRPHVIFLIVSALSSLHQRVDFQAQILSV